MLSPFAFNVHPSLNFTPKSSEYSRVLDNPEFVFHQASIRSNPAVQLYDDSSQGSYIVSKYTSVIYYEHVEINLCEKISL